MARMRSGLTPGGIAQIERGLGRKRNDARVRGAEMAQSDTRLAKLSRSAGVESAGELVCKLQLSGECRRIGAIVDGENPGAEAEGAAHGGAAAGHSRNKPSKQG